MTENQRHIEKQHLAHLEEALGELEAGGFTLVELARWEGGQPTSILDGPNGCTAYMRGMCTLQLYRHGRKVTGTRLGIYNEHNLARLIKTAQAAA